MRLSLALALLLAPSLACKPAPYADPPSKIAEPTKPAAPPNSKDNPGYETRKNHDPDGIGKFYMDREIAYVMGHEAAGWLERPEREKEEHSSKLLKSLELKEGDVVADIGAGTGYFSFPIAVRVGPKGKVEAVEIQQEMLDIIAKRMKEQKVENIDLVLGTETDPKLKDSSVDMMLMVDVYHEFSDPYAMAVNMVKALKPGGRLIFVEFRANDPKVPIKPVHTMTVAQVKKEMALHPLKYLKTIDTLPWQHVIIFEREK